MKLLLTEMEWDKTHNNRAMLFRIPKPIVKWLKHMKFDHIVSWVEGDLFPRVGHKNSSLYVRLINGLESHWTLSESTIFVRYRGSNCQTGKKVPAIKLTKREIEELVRERANLILSGVGVKTLPKYTEPVK